MATAKKKKTADEKTRVFDIALRLATSLGENTVVYDIATRSPLASYAIVCAGASERRLKALAEEAENGLAANGFAVGHVEGKNDSHWFLVDGGDVIVHIFTREERERVAIDTLYAGMPQRAVTEADISAYTKSSQGTAGKL